MRLVRRWLSCAVALGVMVCGAAAQDFPNRPVRIIVPFAPGGPNDVAARLIAEALRPHLGQTVVVENRPGGGGVVGAEVVVTSAPDGYTLLFGTAGPLVVSPTAKPVRYDVVKDFAPIGQVYRSAQAFSVHPKVGVKTAAELVTYAKANPGKLTVGSAGLGTLPHLSIEMLKREAGINVTHVPYRATSGALTDLLGGQIDALFGEISAMAPNMRSGKLLVLGVTSPDRSKLLPEVPTMKEAGFPALAVESWGGLLAPAAVPHPILDRLELAMQKALLEVGFREGSDKQGWIELTTSRAAFAKLIASETVTWKPIVTAPDFTLN
jgi:tripartite-type tricarboxylate transporter receptor subunit TctC